MYKIAKKCLRVYDLSSPAPFFINVMINDALSRIRVLPSDSVATLRGYITELFPGEYDIGDFDADLDEAGTTLRAAGVTPEMQLRVKPKPTGLIPTTGAAPIVSENAKAPAGKRFVAF
eukprot:TRINITY_DN1330_c0_g3_i1.p3 TRINITY_DN1330_c0_g3~~TRINITY_DN1330_c0_g3_i1.p3  ORF type:complete len:118 (+),score=26.49 TRINITY_DN1330_c0_g3_i1:364-717(+)